MYRRFSSFNKYKYSFNIFIGLTTNGLLHLILIHLFNFSISFHKNNPTEELQNLKESESRYKQQYMEAQKREKVLIRRLAAKEQEMQEYVVRTKDQTKMRIKYFKTDHFKF